MKEILIDHPGAGYWVMSQMAATFNPDNDHSICTYENGQILGGFVVTGYTRACALVHMAGRDRRWCSRDLMWMLFDYGFNQLGLRKMLATVNSANPQALEMDIRAGWRVEALIEDAYPDGSMFILSMDPAHCKWLKHLSRNYCSGV